MIANVKVLTDFIQLTAQTTFKRNQANILDDQPKFIADSETELNQAIMQYIEANKEGIEFDFTGKDFGMKVEIKNDQIYMEVNEDLKGLLEHLELVSPTPAEVETPHRGFAGTLVSTLANGAITVGEVRYGGGYLAFITTEDDGGWMQCQLTSGDEDWIALDSGILTAAWFPVGWGVSPLAAMEKLEETCKKLFIEFDYDFDELTYILGLLYSGNVLKDNIAHDKPLHGSNFRLFSIQDARSDALVELLESLNVDAPTGE